MSDSKQYSGLVETVRTGIPFWPDPMTYRVPGQDDAEAALIALDSLEEQLEAATSDDFSLVPKDEYARLKRLEEQLEAAAVLLRYAASADGPGDEYVQQCRAWLNCYAGVT